MPADELIDVAALEARISGVGAGIVALDGAPQAGKSWLMSELARRLRCDAIDLDDHLDEDHRVFVDALRLTELDRRLDAALAASRLVLVAGVCMREVLDKLGRSPALSIYVQRNTPMGIAGDLDMIDAEDGEQSNATKELDALFLDCGVLDREVRHYHERYKPRRNADIIFIRTDSR